MAATMNCELAADYFCSARDTEILVMGVKLMMSVKLMMIYSKVIIYLMLQDILFG